MLQSRFQHAIFFSGIMRHGLDHIILFKAWQSTFPKWESTGESPTVYNFSKKIVMVSLFSLNKQGIFC